MHSLILHYTSAFSKRENLFCSGIATEGHLSKGDAMKECMKNKRCNGVFDVLCDEYLFWPCEGKVESSSDSAVNTSCGWKKGKEYECELLDFYSFLK